ncbi:MAG: putative spermidine/putrescine transport system permease protein [Verrucomicrobiota bacterium]
MKNGLGALVFHGLFIAFIVAPIIVVCLVAFTPEGYLSIPTRSFSLRWFYAISENSQFLEAFLQSARLAVISAAVSVLLIVPSAFAIARYTFPGRSIIVSILQAPLMIPPVVLGIAFLRFLSECGLSATFTGLVLCHAIFVTPFVLRVVLASSTGLDTSLENAATSLGASRPTVFRRVIFPIILPAIATAWVLAFITSFDELTMTTFVAAPNTITLPVRLFLYIQDNIDPLVAAVSAILIIAAVAVMIVLDCIVGLDRLLVGTSGDHSS